MLRGLAYLHARGLVHCDVKPANVLIGDGGRAVLADFESALDQSPDKLVQTMTMTMGVAGTARYMDPEVSSGRARPSPRSDLYSFGVMAEELASLYADARAGRDLSSEPAALQYRDYAAWQRRALDGERGEQLLVWWTEQLEDLPSLDLQNDCHPENKRKECRRSSAENRT